MQRILFALVLILAAMAGASWWLLRSNNTPPVLPDEAAIQASAAADRAIAQGPNGSSSIERVVADASTSNRVSEATASVLQVHAQWPDESPAIGVQITLRAASRNRAYAVAARAVTNESGDVIFRSVGPGKWSLRSDRGDRKTIEATPGKQTVTFELEGGVAVAGVVVGPDQQPIADAAVWLQTRNPLWSGGSVLTRTSSDGTFSLERIPPHVSLGAFARNYTRSKLVDLDIIDTEIQPAKVTLALQAKGGQLHGIVVDMAGKPIPGAWIGIGKQQGHLDTRGERIIEKWSVRTTESDDKGRFVLNGLKPEQTTVSVRARGFGFWRRPCEIVDQQDQEMRIELPRSGTLHGIVKNADGEPLPNASIRCYDQLPRTPFLAGGQIDFDETFGYLGTTSNDNGHYELHDVSAGSAFVYAQNIGKKMRMGQPVPYATAELEMPASGKVEWSPTISDGLTVEGTVFYRDGHPMPNVFVTLKDENAKKQHVQTNNDKGVFRFVNLAQTTYRVHVQMWDAPKGTPPLELAGVAPDSGRIELHALFDKPVKKADGKVSGRIDDAGLRIKNAKNAHVVLSSDDGWFRDGGKIVDGAFHFDRVTPCRFQLTLMEGEAVLATSDWHELQPAAHIDTGVLRTKPGGAVLIELTRMKGAEDKTCKLYFRRDGARRSTTVTLPTSSELLVPNLTPGSYKVTGYGKGVVSIKAKVTVAAGETATLPLELERGFLIKFEAWCPTDHDARRYSYKIAIRNGRAWSRDGEFGSQSRRPHAFSQLLPPGDYTVDYETGDLAGRTSFRVSEARSTALRINPMPK